MLPSRTLSASYLTYAVGLLCAAATWGLFFADWLLYWRVDEAVPDAAWYTLSQTITRWTAFPLFAAVAAMLLGFGLAISSGTEDAPAARSHRLFLLRVAPVAVLCLILLSLTEGRMGSFDVDLISLAVLFWCGWLLAKGWRAFSTDAAVAGPWGWQLALALDVVAGGLFALFLCCFRMVALI